MTKVRVHEIAREMGINSKNVIEVAQLIDIELKSANSSVNEEEANLIVEAITNPSSIKNKEEKEIIAPVKKETKPVYKEEAKVDEKPVEAQETLKAEPKKMGLVIVKKKKVEENIVSNKEKSNLTKKYGSLSKEALSELNERTNKTNKKAPVKKKEVGAKLNILGERSLDKKDVHLDYDEQEVLIDLHQVDTKEVVLEENKAKKNLNNNKFRPVKRSLKRSVRKSKIKPEEKPKEEIKTISIADNIRVYEFAQKIEKKISEVIMVLLNLGIKSTQNDFLDKDSIEILAEEFKVEVNIIDPKRAFDYVEVYDKKYTKKTEERPPIVTIMGHVDHGKTSLLDKIRSSKIASKEAGGITQHIGAYSVKHSSKYITFIDTPGHAAFTNMRARGASITDLVIVVVAADDGVKPQTKEALSHVKEANVPLIIAINKMDKAGANPDKVKAELADIGYTTLDWGGEYESLNISAITGEGLDKLLDTILIQAELLELKANPKDPCKATVIESSVQRGRGVSTTVIVNNGTLKVGDSVVCGKAYGRVKSILDINANNLKSLGPSFTAQIFGLNEVPNSGDVMVAIQNDKEARELAEKRALYEKQQEMSLSMKSTIEDLGNKIAEGKIKLLKLIVKTDVHGSLEAITSSLSKLKNEEVKVSFVHRGVGGINENDVNLASSTKDCIIIGFNVRPTGNVKVLAKKYGVDIKTYSVIYEMINDISSLLGGMMDLIVTEENTGQAEVRDTFSVPKVGVVAGCFVSDGKIVKDSKARLIRDGVVIYTTTIVSLKRFKDDAKEVLKGYECGIMLNKFNDIKNGDYIETFIEKKEEATL